MLKAPRWCAHAVPTQRGWQDPSTGELFVASRFTQEQINEFFGKDEKAVDDMYGIDHDYTMINEQVEVEAPQMLHEAPVHKPLESMTKNELIALAEQKGISVSKFSTKRTLVEKLS